MDKNYENLVKSIEHLKTLTTVFSDKNNYEKMVDWNIYNDNYSKLNQLMSSPEIEMPKQLYDENGRQMILADIIEYIFFGRGYYAITKGGAEKKKLLKSKFIEIMLRYVNVLMCYESMTADKGLRKKFLEQLKNKIPEVGNEELFEKLKGFEGNVGISGEGDEEVNDYFDTILPKTAGGLWHEILVFAFLLRYDLGYIVPLLLHQKLLSGSDSVVPPDFLLITREKDIYGVEVGRKKEIQSGAFSLTTNIPTASVDTENSRNSDRCPLCKRWIQFCDRAIQDFSNLDKPLAPVEIKCLDGTCSFFPKEEIAEGKCPYTKYSRNKAKTMQHTHHPYADGKHYHYSCVLDKLSEPQKKLLIQANDLTALKTHYLYYAGLEMLFK